MAKLIFSLLLLISTPLFAADDTYTCVIKDLREVSANGLLVKPNAFVSSQIGTSFIIRKKTGEILGEYVNTDNAYTRDVLDKGGEENSYKALSTYGPNREILYVEVLDNSYFRNKSPRSFIGFILSSTFSGYCK